MINLKIRKLSDVVLLDPEKIANSLYLKYRIINNKEDNLKTDVGTKLEDISNLLSFDNNFFLLDKNYINYILEINGNIRQNYSEYREKCNNIITKLNNLVITEKTIEEYKLSQERLRNTEFECHSDLKNSIAYDYLTYIGIAQDSKLNDDLFISSTNYFINSYPELFTKEYLKKTKDYLDEIIKSNDVKVVRQKSKETMKRLTLF